MKSGKYSQAAGRWEGIGPYYAMFPISFAKKVIRKYSVEGDIIFDPFVGRGTSIFAAAIDNRSGIGIEINPVGWVYTKAKLFPVPLEKLEERLDQVYKNSYFFRREVDSLPDFFRYCYSRPVLNFLLAARTMLKWRSNNVDAVLMALILVNLHGKRGNALSNQMMQTKSMSPQYSIEWWKRKKMTPPAIDPYEFLLKKIQWRYKKGFPNVNKSFVYLGDSIKILPKIKESIKKKEIKKPKLLFTSPPYLGVTNYHYDQWLRLWMLGQSSIPTVLKDRYKKRFNNVDEYKELLRNVFNTSSDILDRNAVVYIRTDRRRETYNITKTALKNAFPKKKMTEKTRLFYHPTQTQLFNRKIKNSKNKIYGGEIDFILTP